MKKSIYIVTNKSGRGLAHIDNAPETGAVRYHFDI